MTASKCARVVELADSLDSGSSAHYGRAGSSPASRTTSKVVALDDLAFVFSRFLRFPYECCTRRTKML